MNNVFVLQLLDQVDLLLDANSVRRGQLEETDRVPGHLQTFLVVHAFVDNFVRTTPQLLLESFKSTLWRSFNYFLVLLLILVFFFILLLFLFTHVV